MGLWPWAAVWPAEFVFGNAGVIAGVIVLANPREAAPKAQHGDGLIRRVLLAIKRYTDLTVGKWLAAAGVSPNQVTYAGMYGCWLGCGVFALQWLYHPLYVVGLIVFLVFAASDFIDGSLARCAPHRKTPFGGVLDSLTDRKVEGAMIFACQVVLATTGHTVLALLGTPALIGFDSVPYARAKAESLMDENGKSKDIKADMGPGERPVRMVTLGLGVLPGYWWTPALAVGFVLSGLLAWVTAMRRERAMRNQLDDLRRRRSTGHQHVTGMYFSDILLIAVLFVAAIWYMIYAGHEPPW